MTNHPAVEGKQHRPNLVEAVPADADEIARVFIEARQQMTYLPRSAHTEAETVAFFRSLIENPANLVLEARTGDGQIGGFGVFGEGRMDHLYVRPDEQRRGLGTALIEAAQKRFRHLEGWVFEKNVEAIELYLRHGFEVVERTDGARNEEGEPDVRVSWSRS
jgi:ribosomal protein S18 acetylase RimI-like enzyme